MKHGKHLFLLWIFTVYLPLPVFAADPVKNLRADLDKIFSENRLADAQLGVEVFSLDRTEVLYEKNSSKLYMPASNNKVLTAAAALICLGPDYNFKTRVLGDGPIVNGALKGDLIIAGFGDPFSSSRIPPKDPFKMFKEWAARLQQQGINSIAGKIIGDGGSFEETEYGRGWAWDDLTESYAAPVTALQFNENLIWLEISPGLIAGDPAFIKMDPLAAYLTINNKVITDNTASPARIEVNRNRFNEAVSISGAISPQGPTVSRVVAVQLPVRYYLAALKQALSEAGIDVTNCDLVEARNVRSQSASLLWIHTSPPLSEILPAILKMSLNLGAETLVRTLGMELRGEGSFAKGKEVVEEALSRMGLDKGTYSYIDGSGLSRLNLISAGALIRVLQYMHQHEFFPHFYGALSIAGIDGTLANRMKKTKAENNVHAKTGTYANASSLSGYVQTSDGEMLAFSILVNNYLASKDIAENVQDRALGRLAHFSRKAKITNKTASNPVRSNTAATQ